MNHWGTPMLFQYGSRGRLPGYGCDLDLDVFYGDAAARGRHAARTGSASTPASKPVAKPVAKPTVPAAPGYPLPAGSYFGPKSGPAQSVSGYYSHRADLERWQQRMHDRGRTITPDGLYGPGTERVARAFQQEKHLSVDGLIGRNTWTAAWTSPVT